METSANKRVKRYSSLESNPQWIENLLLKLLASNESQTCSVGESFSLVKSVVNILLSAVANYDARFSFRAVDSSSFFVEKATNHFELLVFVRSQSLRPAEIRFQGEACQGLALIEMVQDTVTYRAWKSFCRKSKSGKEYLSSKMLRSELSNLLSKLLADMLYLQHYHDKTMEGIEIRNISSEGAVCLEIKIRGLTLIVDLAIAIDCEGLWPVQDFCREGQKLCKQISSANSKRKTVNCGIQLVSKSTPMEYHWNIWFCHR